jgi:DNA polymerase III subunit epsilon
MRILAIDFETANHRRDSACAVGLAWIEEGAVVRRAERLIRPPTLDFAPGNIRVHGIRPRDVLDAPSFPEAMAEFLPEIEGALVLAHNARFDVGVLLASLAAHGRPAPAFGWLCTLQVSRRTWLGERRHGLAHAAARIGHAFAHHEAGADADACARIALAAAERAGTDVPGLFRALAIEPGRVRGGHPAADPPDQPRGAAWPPARAGALGSAPGSAPGSALLAFTVEGSTGNAYAIAVDRAREGLHARCTCTAGRMFQRCRHVTALLDGDVTDLRSDNHDDVERLRRMVVALGADAVLPPPRLRRAA